MLNGRYKTPNVYPPSTVGRFLYLPNDPQVFAAVIELLTRLNFKQTWDDSEGGLTAQQTAELCAEMWLMPNPLLGSIIPVVMTSLPDHLLPCDGSQHSINEYPELVSVLDTYYVDTFNGIFYTPDLRGVTILGAGHRTGLTDRVANTRGGEETHTLTIDQIPAHSHTTVPHSHIYSYPFFNVDVEGAGVPDISAVGNPGTPQNTSVEGVTVNDTGGGQSHNNMPPFIVLRYAIVAR